LQRKAALSATAQYFSGLRQTLGKGELECRCGLERKSASGPAIDAARWHISCVKENAGIAPVRRPALLILGSGSRVR
jgi:hypothetical protein